MTAATSTVTVIFAIGLSVAAPVHTGAAQTDAPTADRIRALEESQQTLVSQLRELEQRIVELRGSLSGTVRSAPAPVLPATPIPMASTHAKGQQSAAVAIIEYSDFQCPYCATFARDTLPALEARYISNGQIRFGFWHRPLMEIHPQAIYAAEAAECAGRQNKFWQMHDTLFSDQEHLDPPSLVAQARRLELDMPAFANCVQGEGAAKVTQDLAAANVLRFGTTPTFVIGTIRDDGALEPKHVLVGARDLSAFAAVIDPLVAEISARRPNR